MPAPPPLPAGAPPVLPPPRRADGSSSAAPPPLRSSSTASASASATPAPPDLPTRKAAVASVSSAGGDSGGTPPPLPGRKWSTSADPRAVPPPPQRKVSTTTANAAPALPQRKVSPPSGSGQESAGGPPSLPHRKPSASASPPALPQRKDSSPGISPPGPPARKMSADPASPVARLASIMNESGGVGANRANSATHGTANGIARAPPPVPQNKLSAVTPVSAASSPVVAKPPLPSRTRTSESTSSPPASATTSGTSPTTPSRFVPPRTNTMPPRAGATSAAKKLPRVIADAVLYPCWNTQIASGRVMQEELKDMQAAIANSSGSAGETYQLRALNEPPAPSNNEGQAIQLYSTQACQPCTRAGQACYYNGNLSGCCVGCSDEGIDVDGGAEHGCDLNVRTGIHEFIQETLRSGQKEVFRLFFHCKACLDAGVRCFQVDAATTALCTRCEVNRTECDMRPYAIFAAKSRFMNKMGEETGNLNDDPTASFTFAFWQSRPFPPEHLFAAPDGYGCKGCLAAGKEYIVPFTDLKQCVSCTEDGRQCVRTAELQPNLEMSCYDGDFGKANHSHHAPDMAHCTACRNDKRCPAAIAPMLDRPACEFLGFRNGRAVCVQCPLAGEAAMAQCDMHREIIKLLDMSEMSRARATCTWTFPPEGALHDQTKEDWQKSMDEFRRELAQHGGKDSGGCPGTEFGRVNARERAPAEVRPFPAGWFERGDNGNPMPGQVWSPALAAPLEQMQKRAPPPIPANRPPPVPGNRPTATATVPVAGVRPPPAASLPSFGSASFNGNDSDSPPMPRKPSEIRAAEAAAAAAAAPAASPTVAAAKPARPAIPPPGSKPKPASLARPPPPPPAIKPKPTVAPVIQTQPEGRDDDTENAGVTSVRDAVRKFSLSGSSAAVPRPATTQQQVVEETVGEEDAAPMKPSDIRKLGMWGKTN